MDFEFFTHQGRAFCTKASIRKQGQIGLNQASVRKFELSDKMCAVLGYDKQQKAVAIKLTKDKNENGARPVSVRGGSASISAKAFLDYFEIDYHETESYQIHRDDKTGLLIFRLVKEDEPT